MSQPATPPLTLEEAERRAIEAAVAAARADPRPSIPHEVVRAKLLRERERLRQKLGLPPE